MNSQGDPGPFRGRKRSLCVGTKAIACQANRAFLGLFGVAALTPLGPSARVLPCNSATEGWVTITDHRSPTETIDRPARHPWPWPLLLLLLPLSFRYDGGVRMPLLARWVGQ